MEAGDVCAIDDVEPWEVYREESRRARKEYRCFECGRTIEPRESYLHSTGKLDGDWLTQRICAHCAAAGQWMVKVCGGWMLGGLDVELKEHWDEEPELRHLWLGRVIVAMSRQWKRRDGQLMAVPTLKLPPKYLAAHEAAA